MSLLFVIFSVIYGVSFFINKDATSESIYNELSMLEKNYNSFEFYNEKYFVTKIFENGNFVILDGNMSINNEQVTNIVTFAQSKNYLVGSFNSSIYYIFNDDKSMLFVLDVSDIITRFNETQIKLLIGFSILYALSSILAVVFSNIIIQPIKKSFYRQKKFISDASHELKTPVAVISANADVLKIQGENVYLDNIKSQTERMKVLVNNMLTLSRIDEDKPKLNKSTFSLSDEIIKVILPFDAVAFENKKFLEFDVPDNISYYGDSESLKKVLTILLDNAIKYADSGSTVKVKLKKEKSKISVSVFNNGSQIESDESSKIFDRFYRGDYSRSSENGGSGLGLSIAKSICDLNKWKIFAKSIINESMTITIIL